MKKFFKYLLSYIFYPFSFLFPRKEGRLAFGAPRNRFEGNPKYLFIEYSNKGLDVCWISASKECCKRISELGLNSAYLFSLKGIKWALSSKWWIVGAYSSDILFAFSGGAKIFNLWHGVGLKLCEFNIKSGPLADRYVRKTLKERFYHPECFKRPDLMLTASAFQSDMFSPAFRINKSQCIEMDYPRNSILTWEESLRKEFIEKYERLELRTLIQQITDSQQNTTSEQIAAKKNKFNCVYVYMPTWRDNGGSALSSMDFDRLNSALIKANAALIVKDHFNNSSKESHREGNIFYIHPSEDIYPILPYTDVLITDYSSVLYDYILMENKKVILYLYDYKDYETERDFFYPFSPNVVGEKIYDFDTLEKLIISGETPALDKEKRAELISKFWKLHNSSYDFNSYLHI